METIEFKVSLRSELDAGRDILTGDESPEEFALNAFHQTVQPRRDLLPILLHLWRRQLSLSLTLEMVYHHLPKERLFVSSMIRCVFLDFF